MKTKILIFIAASIFASYSCVDDVLDRPDLTHKNDDNYWTSETNLRYYSQEYYERYFSGYGRGGKTEFATYLGYMLNDDIVTSGAQEEFELDIPSARGDNKPTFDEKSNLVNIPWLAKYSGPDWSFAWVRKSNIMLNRIETRMGNILNEEQKSHWLAIGRFFRAMEYAQLVQVFGDVPYYDYEVLSNDDASLYKPRTPRDEVMDAVYDDLMFAFDNIRTNDGDGYVNKYIVAAYITRLALFEGTWQRYHENNIERAKKFLQQVVEKGDFIRNSGKYAIQTPFRELFGSNDLSKNTECIMIRRYDAGLGVSHGVASQCNLVEKRAKGANLSLIKAFLCTDGRSFQTSTVEDAKNFELSNLVKTRDPRFEASFWDKPNIGAKSSLLYITKFISREALTLSPIPAQYTGTLNENDAPVMRYAEVLLNWIEAKAELAELGGQSVTQLDIDRSINVLRDRPLDATAKAKGVQKTAALNLKDLSMIDLDKDPTVSELMWEIRRERRMELAFEHSRLLDLKRWKKLEYMDSYKYPDLLRGTWVDIPNEMAKELLGDDNVDKTAVADLDGNVTVFDGGNSRDMKGFYSPTDNRHRIQFLNVTGVNPYLAPVGINQRVEYQKKGYELAQTKGWSDMMP